MAWPMEMEAQWAGFRPVGAGLLALATLALLLGPVVARHRRRTALRWSALGALGLGAVALAIVAAQRGDLRDLGAAVALYDTPARHVGQAIAVLTSLPVLALAGLLLAGRAMAARAWPVAYAALAAGPGLVAFVLVLKVVLPREPPHELAFLAGPVSFPNDGAALGLGLALLAGLVGARLGPRWLTPAGWAAGGAAIVAPILAGQAYLTDTLAGLGLALAWVGACRAGLAAWESLAIDDAAAQGRPWSLRAWDAIDRRLARAWAKPGPWLLAAIAIGVMLRLASWWTPLAVDAFSYAAMGRSLQVDGSFTMPWGDVDTFHTEPVPSHHYPPLYPTVLAGMYSVFGFSQQTTHLAAIATSLLALLVVWWCTRDLYGGRKAMVATAAIALLPTLVQNTGQGYSENLVLALFTLTLWAILKSLRQPWWIVGGGAFAGLGYLTKSSLGYFFILAGLGGLAWRLHWRGLKALRDPSYLVAIAVFGAMVVAWAARNVRHFGSWETSAHLSSAYGQALREPGTWIPMLLACLVFYAAFAYLLHLGLLPWLPTLARAPKLGSEHDSGLWLALGLPLLLTAAIDASLWLVEHEFFLNNIRYVAFVAVPAAWLLLRNVPAAPPEAADGSGPTGRSVRAAASLTFGLLLVGSLFFAKPYVAHDQAIADDLGARLQPGDTVGFVDRNNHAAYRYYHQLTADGTREVDVAIACLDHPLCPDEVPRASELRTTWVLAPYEAAAELADAYVRVPGSPADAGPHDPSGLTLWRLAPGLEPAP